MKTSGVQYMYNQTLNTETETFSSWAPHTQYFTSQLKAYLKTAEDWINSVCDLYSYFALNVTYYSTEDI